ncbi:MAG TPA: ABC transporter substrate-binding protein [Gemmatimonadales bacterium]|nr:ABC transporter substrate-binding protein [Gemmatimonadales bacterium]
MTRVVTLLPAATEIVAALGDASVLVGISHECDYPAHVQHLRRVTTTSIHVAAASGAIDAEVRSLRESGRAVIAVDAEEIRRLNPDVIVTQALCEVCAVSDGEVHRLAATLDRVPRLVSLSASTVDGIWTDIRAVGRAIEMDDEAEELVLGLRSRLETIGNSAEPVARPRVLCIEWLDPVYLAGHWIPELVELHPDYLIVMLCGFGIERARAELARLEDPRALELLHRVSTWIIDGNAYTSRPGPRVVDGAARIQSILLDAPMAGVERWETAGICS